MKAILLHPSGDLDHIDLEDDEIRRVAQLQKLVGGYLEVVALKNRYMVINENGKIERLEENPVATVVAHDDQAILPDDYIVGISVIVPKEAIS